MTGNEKIKGPVAIEDLPWREWTQGVRYKSRFRVLSDTRGDGRKIGIAYEELPPGKQSVPFHYHLLEEEHIIALEPMDKGLMGTLLRYPYEVRSADEYFDDIQDVKVTKDMLDLARHIVNQKAGHFEPDKFEDQYETALLDLINQKRAGKPITAKERPRGENVVDLMDALRKSIGRDAAAPTEEPKKPVKKPRKAAAG